MKNIEYARGILMKHWFLILLTTVIVAAGAVVGTKLQPATPPYYSSFARLQFANPASLADKYVLTVLADGISDAVLSPVATKYDGLTVALLQSKATVTPEGNTVQIRVTVRDSNADRAASLANDIAASLITYENQSVAQEYQPAEQLLMGQITDVQTQIGTLQQRLDALAPGDSQRPALEAQLIGLRERESLLQYSLTTAQVGQSTAGNPLHVVLPAVPGILPTQSNALDKSLIAVALLFGFFAGLGLALLRDRLDQRVRSPKQISEQLGWPDLTPRRAGEATNAANGAGAPARSLATGLDLLGLDRPLRAIAVTGARPGDAASTASSTAAAEMARALAVSGKQVILVDASLRHPSQRDRFGVAATSGFTDALLALASGKPAHDVLPAYLAAPADATLRTLRVMPAGTTAPDPEALLRTQAAADLCAALASSGADLVIFDVADTEDAAVLAAQTDGVLIAVSATTAQRNKLAQTRDILTESSARVLGFVDIDQPLATDVAASYVMQKA